jgi:hypothetical protein
LRDLSAGESPLRSDGEGDTDGRQRRQMTGLLTLLGHNELAVQ